MTANIGGLSFDTPFRLTMQLMASAFPEGLRHRKCSSSPQTINTDSAPRQLELHRSVIHRTQKQQQIGGRAKSSWIRLTGWRESETCNLSLLRKSIASFTGREKFFQMSLFSRVSSLTRTLTRSHISLDAGSGKDR